MIKLIKLGMEGFGKRMWLNLFIFLETVIVIVAANVIISNINSRWMLYKPLEYLAEKRGYIFSIDDGETEEEEIDENENYYENNIKVMKKIEKKLKGDISFHRVYEFSGFDEGKKVEFNVFGFEDEFYKGMSFPLKSGSWGSVKSGSDEEYIECVVTPNNKGYGVGSIIKSKKGDEVIMFKVVGVLTDSTYVTSSGTWGYGCKGYFQSYTLKDADEMGVYMYANGDKLKSVSGSYPSDNEFITYNRTPSEYEYKYNNTVLGKRGYVFTTEQFKKNSLEYIEKLIRRTLPIYIGVIVIIGIGIICATIIQIKSRMREYSIYYLCGAGKRQCVFVSVVYNLMVTGAAVIIGVCSFIGIYYSAVSEKIGLIVNEYNIYTTLAVVAVLLLVSAIVPFVKLGMVPVKELLINEQA